MVAILHLCTLRSGSMLKVAWMLVVQQWQRCLMIVEVVVAVPMMAVVEVVTLVEVVSMLAMVAEVAVFVMMEEFRGGWGSDDNCSSAVIWGEAMMAVVRCSGGSFDNLSGGGDCISAIEVKHYHYDTTNCHKCHQCTSPLPSLPQQTTPVQLA